MDKRIRKPREGEKAGNPANSSARAEGIANRGRAGPGLRVASAAYALSAHDPKDFPSPGVPEIAFAGRSNAGKSSAINALTGRRRLAFASKTPGRTQLINFFSLEGRAFLVDLPGYGYAGVPEAIRRHWQRLVGEYVRDRACVAGLIVVMDARHPLTALDCQLLDWLAPAGRRVHVLLTKSDKLSPQAASRTLAETRRELERLYPGSSVQLFSSLRRVGLSQAAATIEAWADTRGAAQRGVRKTKAPAKGE